MSEGRSYFDAAGYEVQTLLGKGSDARVWLVRDKKFGHLRALKVLNDTVGEDLDSSDSFFRECALLLRVCNGGHPNIVRIGRPRVIENKAMVEMQYVQGRTLTDYIHTDMHFVPYEEVLKFVHDIGGALAYCHAEGYKWMMAPGEDKTMSKEELIAHYGVAHNDLHSSNVMRNSVNDSYILLDFGLAIQDGVAVRSSLRNEGHPEYRAPEKFEAKMGGKQGDIRVDVYAFGILLFEMLAGDTPFHANPGDLETGKIYRLHKEMPVPDIEPRRKEAFLSVHPGAAYVKDYPGWLENMVRKCLAKNPDARYANMKEFMDEFEANIDRDKKLSARRLDALNKEKGELAKENSELQASIKELEKQIETLKEVEKKIKTAPVVRKEVKPKPAPVPRPDRDQEPPKEKASQDHMPVWQGVLMSGLPLIAIGGVAAANRSGFSLKDSSDGEVVENVEVDNEVFLDTASLGPIPVASSVSGAASFGKAFSAARHEVGPGGVFRWQGNLYSTYTADEWKALTPEQKSEFEDRVREADIPEDQEPDTIVAEVNADDDSYDDGSVIAAQLEDTEVSDDVVADDSVVIDDTGSEIQDSPSDGFEDDGMGVEIAGDLGADQMDDAGVTSDI